MKYNMIIPALLMSLLVLVACGPVYPEGETEVNYPVPEFSDADLQYNSNRQVLHCEITVHYDSAVTDIRADLNLEGFEVASLEIALNDSGLYGDALRGDNVYSRNIDLDRIDSLDGLIIAEYDIYENGISIKNFTDSLEVIANLPPEITELTMPDTLTKPREGSIAWYVYVSVDDPDGLYDVTNAFCQSYSNSSGSWNDYPLYDNGENGDETAGDAIFSTGFQLPSTTPSATYYFRFRVKDSAANFSDWSLDSVVVR